MKKIGIDARLINQTGVGTYIRNLLYYLPSDKSDISFYVYTRNEDKDIVPKKSSFITRFTDAQWHTLDEQLRFLRVIQKDQLDLMHFTYFSYPFLYRRPFVITIHDITPLLYATGRASTHNPLIYHVKKAVFKLMLKNAVQKSKKVFVPSKTVKANISEYFGSSYNEKMLVTYEGVDTELSKQNGNKPAQTIQKPYFLYIGNFYPHKNVEHLIKAFLSVDRRYSLYLIGPHDYFFHRIKALISDLSLSDRIFFDTSPSTSEIVWYYRNATALIHPSLAEGFGLPLIEASYFHLPIIASDIPVIHEVLGKYFLPCDPYDPDDIAKKISNFLALSHQEKYYLPQDYLESTYSFEKMAELTYRQYQSLVSSC